MNTEVAELGEDKDGNPQGKEATRKASSGGGGQGTGLVSLLADSSSDEEDDEPSDATTRASKDPTFWMIRGCYKTCSGATGKAHSTVVRESNFLQG